MSSKIFIIGLPRTGTTSICNSFLQLGYKTAHTAYTQQAITTADVIADTP
ncbi:MAG: sulfotransferase, partial [Pseudomonadota bacterium]